MTSQRRHPFGKKTLKSCASKMNLDNVVLIDVDGPTDRFHNVIVIDVPESLDQERQGTGESRGGQRFPFQGVISIDDDDDETDNEGNTGIREESGCDLESDASSSKDHFPSDFVQTSKGLDQDGCSNIQGKRCAFKRSKCKKTYSEKTSCGKRYGLSPESDSTSLESDLSDCELMEGSVGKLREQWEKAFRRRKFNVSNSQSGLEDQISVSGSPNDTNPSTEEENPTEQRGENPACSSSIDANVQKQNSSAFQAVGDGLSNSVNSDAQSDENELQQSCSMEAENLLLDATSGHRERIIDREKLKETDDYKRAVEEEWASRQRELKLQAEEAQRLRKRRRAESMRLLDMERRQKQRVEEMRETQKKDEENMNTKEQLRNEVRKELIKLELSCMDMTSLLRSLGVHVEGGFQPLASEVHAAYKRALLRFHPDRTSRTDIRQQVEAEEKFKLVTRMKEKFKLITS